MYLDELLLTAANCTDKRTKSALINEVYQANLALIVNFRTQYCYSRTQYDDFMQLAYLAMVDTCQSYAANPHPSSLAHFRIWLKNECYRFWRKSKQPGGVKEVFLNTEIMEVCEYKKSYKMAEPVEEIFMRKYLWERIDTVLSIEAAQIVKRRFLEQKTLVVIGKEFHISAEQVRKRILKYSALLARDEGVKEVARYYHYY